jgi:hypothetical protein
MKFFTPNHLEMRIAKVSITQFDHQKVPLAIKKLFLALKCANKQIFLFHFTRSTNAKKDTFAFLLE